MGFDSRFRSCGVNTLPTPQLGSQSCLPNLVFLPTEASEASFVVTEEMRL